MLALLAALSCAVGAAVVNAAHNITVYSNDTSVVYTGLSWYPYTNCGGSKYDYSKGQFFTFDFTGVAVYLVGTQSEEGGVMSISLDGDQTTYDRYAVPPYRCGVEWYSKTGLANTTHSLVVTLTANSPENSTINGFVEWEWLQYTVLDPGDLVSSSSSASSTSASTSTSSSSTTTTPAASSAASHSSNGAAIGGGIAGAIIAIIAIAALVFFCMRKKNNDQYTGTSRPDLAGDNNVYANTGYAASSPVRNSMAGGGPATAWTPDPVMAQQLGPGPGPVQPQLQQQPMQQPQRPTVAVPSAYPYPGTSSYTSTQGPMSTVSSTTPFLAAGASQFNTGTSQYNPYPDSVNPANPYFNPGTASTGGPSSATSGSGSGGVMPGPLRAQNAVMSDPDVDRIAARVATMIAGSGPSPGTSNPPAETFDAPPPVYNEKSGLH